ncbi:MAG: hypothetical protein U9Q70_04175 [Chloroflexota bacterium]|nr:hypothetical protein [Chloroflexota bacterium]
MSTRILIIPEDFRKDQYMLKPIIQALLDHLGRPTARVVVCQDPLLGGVSVALKKEKLIDIFEAYAGMVDLFLLCVDRDCEETRTTKLQERERWAKKEHDCKLIAANAWQAIEVWILAGHDLPPEWSWHTVRAECHPKEHYFEPLVKQRELFNTPAAGRKILAEEAARRYMRIRQLCPEDILPLEARVADWLAIPH